jgi:hypothetical protein
MATTPRRQGFLTLIKILVIRLVSRIGNVDEVTDVAPKVIPVHYFFISRQGDQIGRIFAYWVTVYFG